MSIRAVVFDFGNVLAYFSHRKAAEQLAAFAPAGVTADEIIAFLFDAELEARFESGEIPSVEVLGLLRSRLGLAGSDGELAHAYADMFSANEEVCSLVPHLQGRYRLLLLSNTNDLHYRHFRRQFADVLDRFDGLVTSHEVGLRKPDPRIYEYTGRLAGARPAECLFIDDLPANVEGARACGWQGVVYRKGDDLRRLLLEVGVELAA